MSADDDFADIVQSIVDESSPSIGLAHVKSEGTLSSPPLAFSYSPDVMVDLIICNPSWDMKQLGQVFGQTPGWVSKVLSTKAFQDALEPRRTEVLNPEFAMTLQERFQALTIRSLSVMQEKLEAGKALPDLTILKAAELGVKALGMGMKAPEEKPAEVPKNSSETVAERIMAAMQKRKSSETAIDVEAVEVRDERSS
jgi:hypothetical protein